MEKGNVFTQIPADLSNEVFEVLVQSKNVKIERIISKGHTSPDTGWYVALGLNPKRGNGGP